MTAHLNVTRAQQRKRVLIVAANPTTSTVTGWPVGFWWAELTHPYWAFTEAGYDVELRSPQGGALVADSFSDPEDESGYSADDLISLGFKRSPRHRALLEDTRSIADVNPARYDAIFLVGGQAPMFSFRGDAALSRLVVAFHEAGKITALVCHATCLLLEARLPSGALLVAGKTWTGFANSEERFADEYVGQRLQPFWIEEEARKLEGTNFVVDQRFRAFAVRDGLLVTGQQQFSGAAAAQLVIEALGR
ncbi:MAG: type 1 glutamine amidotransferase domain-containing protein [Myxococcales bacterium]|nr:type 1 glutamine amidotransferase domain-containing protein [Myxococcales bacterium]